MQGFNTFTEDQLTAKEPIAQFADWFKKATESDEVFEANSMILSTATKYVH